MSDQNYIKHKKTYKRQFFPLRLFFHMSNCITELDQRSNTQKIFHISQTISGADN